jgi:ComF family protein
MKFARQWRWAEWLGAELARAAPGVMEGGRVAVCPVPIHLFRRLSRGYNQAHLIAEAFAAPRGWPVVEALRRTRHTKPQTRVARAERRENIRGAFGARAIDLDGWDLWLVDDVKTTGSTLIECARLLRRAGARRISLAVIAVAEPHGAFVQKAPEAPRPGGGDSAKPTTSP